MHQPFYKDLWTGQYKLPWTRLHALKDYAGMVRILDEFPKIHQTFNLVPSMLVQIEEYAAGKASDPFLDCALLPAEDLSEAQRAFILKYFFQANVGRIIRRYPRYQELHEKQDRLSTQDLRDLQILSQIAWFDEDLLVRDPELAALVRKGRDYSLEDQKMMGRKQLESLGMVLPVYREFAARGQIEISTTPFYHPILPLLCDSDIAGIAHPGVPLPRRFQFPEDAFEQLQRARVYMQEKLGTAPVGLWPSEGSVSDHAIAIAAECGFTWAATDNGVLARTISREATPEVTYKSYIWQQSQLEMRMIFRDHFLSDLIGFQYSGMGAEEAAAHFLEQIRRNADGRESLVPIILDGENAWEWYAANGRPFLRELYRRISEAPDLEALTVSEALAKFRPEPLQGIFPASWINANFDVWIGAEEDNQSWNYLLDARLAYDRATNAAPEDRALAYEEILISEGSDWNWWYGPEHRSDNRPEFDELYRDHLANVYRALKLDPPAALSHPILREQPGEFHEQPTNRIHPTLDGKVTSFFEWSGAGRYRPDPRSGAMDGGVAPAREMFYGGDFPGPGPDGHGQLYVRLDGAAKAAFGIEFETGPAKTEVVTGTIVEMSAPRDGNRFRVTVKPLPSGGTAAGSSPQAADSAQQILTPSTIPADGWIDIG